MSRRLHRPRDPVPPLRHPAESGGIQGFHVLLAVTGMGPRRAATAADEILRTWRPDLLLIAGVAGALDPELTIGEVIVASAVYTEDAALTPTFDLASPSPSHRTGPLLSRDRVLVTPEEKRAARSHTPTLPHSHTPTSPHTHTKPSSRGNIQKLRKKYKNPQSRKKKNRNKIEYREKGEREL